MKQLTLHSDKPGFYSKILRTACMVIGLVYLAIALTEFYYGSSFNVKIIINLSLGIFFILASSFKSSLVTNLNISLTDTYLRTKEDFSLIRTAHWSQVGKVVLTRFSIRITYKSGTLERFRLPYLSNQEFHDLKQWLLKRCGQDGISYQEKSWWKLF